MFKTVMIVATVVSGVLTALLVGIYSLFPLGWIESLTITAGTCFYHFAMRMFVGAAWSPFQQHNPHARWFREKPFEKKLYATLKVKKWKDRMPTYDPGTFDAKSRTLEEMVQAMCHSELVHETIIVLSFLPLLAAIPFGEFPVFFLTSLASAAFDLSFVIMQRYNRPRVLRLMKRKQEK